MYQLRKINQLFHHLHHINIIDTFVRNYLQYDISNIIYSNTENLKDSRKEKKIEKLVREQQRIRTIPSSYNIRI